MNKRLLTKAQKKRMVENFIKSMRNKHKNTYGGQYVYWMNK